MMIFCKLTIIPAEFIPANFVVFLFNTELKFVFIIGKIFCFIGFINYIKEMIYTSCCTASYICNVAQRNKFVTGFIKYLVKYFRRTKIFCTPISIFIFAEGCAFFFKLFLRADSYKVIFILNCFVCLFNLRSKAE